MKECAIEIYFCPTCGEALIKRESKKDSVLIFFDCPKCSSKEFFKIKGVKDLYPRYPVGDLKISC